MRPRWTSPRSTATWRRSSEVGLVRHVTSATARAATCSRRRRARVPGLRRAAARATPSSRRDSTSPRGRDPRAFGFAARFTHFPIVGLCGDCARRGPGLPLKEERGHARCRCTSLTASSPPRWPPRPRSPRRGGRRRRCGADRELDERRVPLLGVIAAFMFAAQMLNFPVAGGTSGHFLGAALAAMLLGPWLACLVIAVVLGVQAFVFADGGITALGANVLNMGVVGALLAGLVLGRRAGAAAPARLARHRRRRRLAGGRGRGRGDVRRARRLGHRAARHRAAGDARRARADRRRRGGHHRRGVERGARPPARTSWRSGTSTDRRRVRPAARPQEA